MAPKSTKTTSKRAATPSPKLTFETALHKLEEIVSRLENAEVPLETALSLYEEGVSLARFCSKQLEMAERKVELLEDKNGELKTRPFLEPQPDRGTKAREEGLAHGEDETSAENEAEEEKELIDQDTEDQETLF